MWGGDDIHVGLYEDGMSVREASERTVHYMSNRLEGRVNESSIILDLGSGYGGASRKLAKKFDCKVYSLNVSEVQNERNRQFNLEQGLEDKIEIIPAFFEDIPLPDASVDVVWSEDAMDHSHDKPGLFREISRVLKPNGILIFHDLMKQDGVEKEEIPDILERIKLEDMACPALYKELAEKNDLQLQWETVLTSQAATHYQRIYNEIVASEPDIYQHCSRDFLSTMKRGLEHWINGFNDNKLFWGMFEFTKIQA